MPSQSDKNGNRELRNADKYFLLCVCVFLFACGVALLYYSASRWWYSSLSKKWSSTQGYISESRMGGCNRKGTCWPVITYRYNVLGQSYEGNNILAFSNDGYPKAQANEKLLKYKAGTNANVFYDPSDPRSSCLEPGQITRLVFVTLALGGLFVVGASSLSWAVIKGKVKRPIHNEASRPT
jgi:hypothetical protein